MSEELSSFRRAALELLESSEHARDLGIVRLAEASFAKDEQLENYSLTDPLDLACKEASDLGAFMLKIAVPPFPKFRQNMMRRLKERPLRLTDPIVKYIGSMTAQTGLILTSSVEAIPPEVSNGFGNAEVVNGWKFKAVGGRVLASKKSPNDVPSLWGRLFAENVIHDEDSGETKRIMSINYDFIESSAPENARRYLVNNTPTNGGEIVRDENELMGHRALFRAARIELGDRSVDKC